MMYPSDVVLLHHARDRMEALHAETRGRGPTGRRPLPARTALAGGLARLARLLAAVAEDLDPQVAPRRWQPRL